MTTKIQIIKNLVYEIPSLISWIAGLFLMARSGQQYEVMALVGMFGLLYSRLERIEEKWTKN